MEIAVNVECIEKTVATLIERTTCKELSELINTARLEHRKCYGTRQYPVLTLAPKSPAYIVPLVAEDILDENSDDNNRLIELTSFAYSLEGLQKSQKIRTTHAKNDPIIQRLLITLYSDLALAAIQTTTRTAP